MIVYIASICVLCFLQKGYASDCINIIESSRVSCERNQAFDCESAGCCWDASATNLRVQCYKKECKAGYFGWGCKFRCDCIDDDCDFVTGECTANKGCKPGLWGVGCVLEERCTYNDPRGLNYMGRLATTLNGNTCLAWSRTPIKYQFPDGSQAAAVNYCRNPPSTDEKLWCYYIDASNNKRRFDFCNVEECPCPRGRFGINCVSECHCKVDHEQCDTKTGKCMTSGCNPRFEGTDCQECANGYFGRPLCSSTCHCREANEACDKSTGSCTSGCADGWQGIDCQTACDDGKFGPDCQYKCNCKDDMEVCNKIDGSCRSGCKPGYAGRNCWSELPRLTRAPLVSGRDGESVTVRWYQFNNPPDMGDGPVSGYILEYRQRSNPQWIPLPQVQSTEKQVSGLQQNTAYVFHIVAIKGNASGLPSPELQATTCGKPLSPPLNLKFDTRTDLDPDLQMKIDSVLLTWTAPAENSWGCDRITKYRVYVKDVITKNYTLLSEVKDTSTPITNMDSNVNYTIGVSIFNSANIESDLATIIFVSRPGSVRNLKVTPTSTTLTVTWEPPSDAKQNEQILSYSASHRQLQQGSCAEQKKAWQPFETVEKNNLRYEATDLLPYTRYQIVVRAETSAGHGQITQTVSITEAIAAQVAVRNLKNTELTSTLASFSWDTLACSEQNGRERGYRYRLSDITQLPGVIIDEATQTATVASFSLTPFVQYKFVVAFVNEIGSGQLGISPENTVTIQTKAAKPPKVRNFRITERTSSSIKVVFEPPYPPYGILGQYELHYWAKDTSNIVTVMLEPSNQTYVATRLPTNVTYAFKVRASTTQVGFGNWSDTVEGKTEEGVPEPPLNFHNTSRTTESISLEWNPPINTNGILVSYRIQCFPYSKDEQLSSVVKEESASNTSTELTNLVAGMQYYCAIRASTARGFGMPTSPKQFYTLPKAPHRSRLPKLNASASSDQTVILTINKLHSHKQTRTVVVVEELSPGTVTPTKDEAGTEKEEKAVEKGGDAAEEEASPHVKRRDTGAVEPAKNESDSSSSSSSSSSPCNLDFSQLAGYSSTSGVSCYITAELSNEIPHTFVVGDGVKYGSYTNQPLVYGRQYHIWLGFLTVVDGVSVSYFTRTPEPVTLSEAPQPTQQPEMASAVIAVIVISVILLIVIIILLIFFIMKRRRPVRHRPIAMSGLTDTDVLESMNSTSGGKMHERTMDDDEGWESRPLIGQPAVSARPRYEPVKLPNLLTYITDKEKNRARGFQQEYEALPSGILGRCDCARRPENKSKNRYGNIIAYDGTRVVLETLPDDPDSDYINANYIDGFNKSKAYIATQGPMKQTVNDFWRMVWQENSSRIAMVTNLVEDGKHKCEQYWPDTGSMTYGSIIIEKVDEEEYADFTIRSFNMTKDGTLKVVRQYHFTAWPDHGVPAYATSLLAFRRKVHLSDDMAHGPIVTHCSAGVGRTGTFILVDILLDQAKADGEVDVFGYLKKIREQRTNLVQALEQYMFVYHALLEAYESGETAIPSRHLHVKFTDLTRPQPGTGLCQLENEFNLLKHFRREMMVGNIENKDDMKDTVDDTLIIEASKEADQIVPAPVKIQGVFIDGYRQREAFLLTTIPSSDTAGDFWNAVYSRDCKTIVSVIETKSSQAPVHYYPQQMETEETFGHFLVSLLSTDKSDDNIIVREFRLAWLNKPGQGKSVRLFEYVAWSSDSSVPPSSASLLSLLASVERWQQRSGNKTVLVNCRDGATRSGLYLAVSNVIERLKLEQEVDVLLTVKLLRVKHAKILPSLDQYRYVYQAAVDYLDGFETYANFK